LGVRDLFLFIKPCKPPVKLVVFNQFSNLV